MNSVGITKSCSVEDSVFYRVWLNSKTFKPHGCFWPTPLFDPRTKILWTHATDAKCFTHVTCAKIFGPTLNTPTTLKFDQLQPQIHAPTLPTSPTNQRYPSYLSDFLIKANKSVYIVKSRQRYHLNLYDILLHVINHALKDMYILNYRTF